jgi:biotin carboxyl carrier protein
MTITGQTMDKLTGYLDGCAYQLADKKPRQVRSSVEGYGEECYTHAGTVRLVNVNEGDWVEEGRPLLLLEALKMEIRIAHHGWAHFRASW